MIIESATLNQAAELALLHQASFGEAAWSVAQLQDSLQLDSTLGFVAIDQNSLVGFILLQATTDEAEILTFCVASNYRRRKIGQQLLQQTMNHLHDKNLFLEVAADNQAACTLYQKMGFELIGKRPHYYKRGKDLIDALTFRLTRFASPA